MRSRHTVTVTPVTVTGTTATGAPKRVQGQPVTVAGTMHAPYSMAVTLPNGDVHADTRWTFFTRQDWPGGPSSLVTWTSDGATRRFTQDGESSPHRVGLRTKHTEVSLVQTASVLP